MPEEVIVRQNDRFEIHFQAADPEDPESEVHPVQHLHELTPYGMMLTSLAACTTIVLHTYAQNHGVALHEAEAHLRYERVFAQDCEDCETIRRYEEQIDAELTLVGDLTDKERQKLFRIGQQCSIHKILEDGIEIHFALAGSNSRETN
jgi:uncharacterized OsmC-like protein